MKRAELKEVIRQAMLDEVTVVDKNTKPQDLPKVDPKTVKSAIDTAKTTQMPVNIAEDKSDALMQLQNILEELQMLADQARDIIAENFPSHLATGEAYGAFDVGSSSNRYDTTLASIVADIEEYGDEGEDEEGEEELNEAPYTMMSKVLPQDYDKITGKINSGLVEMGHWLEQNYDGNALPELQSIQDAYTEFDNKITHGDDEEYEGGDLGTPGDNALGLEEVIKKADAIIAGYRK